MATITKTIGTAARDYSSVASHEADLDNGAVYAAGDVAVGEMYNDSTIDTVLNVNGGGTIGLSSIVYRPASGHGHTGVAGTGVRFVFTTLKRVVVSGPVPTTIDQIEIDHNQNVVGSNSNGVADLGEDATISRWIVHNIDRTASAVSMGIRAFYVSGTQNAKAKIFRNICYDSATYGIRLVVSVSTRLMDVAVYNNTVHDMGRVSGYSGMSTSLPAGMSGPVVIKNNIVTSNVVTQTDYVNFANVTDIGYNLSSDSTAAGSHSLTNQTVSALYVSTVLGAEDLRLASSASPGIDRGVDLGTSPAGVNVDINGTDVDAAGLTWDLGAHEWGDLTPAPSWSQEYRSNGADIVQHRFEWRSNTSGSCTLPGVVSGELQRACFIPSATRVPTAAYDVTLTDEFGDDVLAGQGANLSNTVASHVCPGTPLKDGTTTGAKSPVVDGTLTLNVANAGVVTAGTVVLFMR